MMNAITESRHLSLITFWLCWLLIYPSPVHYVHAICGILYLYVRTYKISDLIHVALPVCRDLHEPITSFAVSKVYGLLENGSTHFGLYLGLSMDPGTFSLSNVSRGFVARVDKLHRRCRCLSCKCELILEGNYRSCLPPPGCFFSLYRFTIARPSPPFFSIPICEDHLRRQCSVYHD